MFNPMCEEEDSFARRVLLAILPGVTAALIPVAFDVWKELRDEKKDAESKKTESEAG